MIWAFAPAPSALLVLILLTRVAVPGPTDEVVVRPPPADGPLDNPLKGWCPYPNAGPIYQPYSMVFQYISWRELEPAEGDFRFEEWEKSWESEAAKDKHIVFRVYVDYPKKPSGLPEWLRTAGSRRGPIGITVEANRPITMTHAWSPPWNG